MHVLGGVLGSWNSSTASRYSICCSVMKNRRQKQERRNHTVNKRRRREARASRRRIADTSRTGSFGAPFCVANNLIIRCHNGFHVTESSVFEVFSCLSRAQETARIKRSAATAPCSRFRNAAS